MQETLFISIEGNIGAGKTTLLNRLVSISDCKRVPLHEPVDAWMNLSFGQDGKGKNLLELFYKDMHAHAFTFQLMTLLTRIEQLQQAATIHKDSILLCDRSYMADAHVFADMLHASGHLSDEQHGVYHRWYDNITQHGLSKLRHAGTIYVRSKPEQCLTRIAQRHRPGEVHKIELPYLEKIHAIHETWLGHRDHQVPVLLLDVDGNPDQNPDQNPDWMVEEANRFIDWCTATLLPGGSHRAPNGCDLQKM